MILRKWGLYALVALLVWLPLVTVWGKDVSAASSRIAVIKSLSGDVQVQKAGGSKSFKAFAKLSLNQGDKLTTGSKGSAVLQFANGTSVDDQFTVSANAVLTFSKLSDKSGTVTKISMLKGTAWVDVKSIKSKDDAFQLETPTAVMGVRGTAFAVRVNPITGSTEMYTMSGVVSTQTSSTGGPATPVYPTQQILITSVDGAADLPNQISIIDIDALIKQSSPEIIEAILRSAAKIQEENQAFIDQVKKTGLPSSMGGLDELDVVAHNLENLIGSIARNAIDNNKLSLYKLDQIIKELNGSNQDLVIDLNKDQFNVTEKEKLKQEELKKKEAELLKKAEEAKKLNDAKEKLAAQLLEQKKKLEEANKKAKEEAQAKAEAALLATLSETEKQKYLEEKARNNGTTSSTTSSGSTLSSNAGLNSLTLSSGQLNTTVKPDTLSYTATVASNVSSLTLTPVTVQAHAQVKVNGVPLVGGTGTVNLQYGSQAVTIVVTAEDGVTTKTYTVEITRAMASASLSLGSGLPLQIHFTAANPSQTFNIPADQNSLSLTVPDPMAIKANGTPVLPTAQLAASTFLTMPTSWTYNIQLQPGSNTIEFTVVIDDVSKTFTLKLDREDDASLESLSLGTGIWSPAFSADTTAYTVTVANTINSVNVTAVPHAESGSIVSGLGEKSLAVGENTLKVIVKAPNGITTRTYTLTVIRTPVVVLSNDATLRALSLSDATLTPAFGANITAYSASVANSVTSVTVAATANATSATILSGKGEKELAVGANTLEVVVRAEDGTLKTYTITVVRAPAVVLSSDATLSALNVSGAELAPAFRPNVTSYTASVPNSVANVIVSATTNATSAAILSGKGERDLAVGVNTLEVVVQAENGTTKHYTVTITRAEAEPLSNDATLSTLSVSGFLLNPEFDPAVKAYTLVVPQYLSLVTVNFAVNNQWATAKLSLNGQEMVDQSLSLESGTNRLEVEVTAQDGTKSTYTITLNRSSTNALLQTLSLEGGVLAPEFQSEETQYVAKVSSEASQVTVHYETQDSGASTLLLRNGSTDGIMDGNVVVLQNGLNEISVVVTAASENIVTYTLVINRAPTGIEISPSHIVKNAHEGDRVGTLTAFDPDGDNTISYMLVNDEEENDEYDEYDNDLFRIEGDQLVLTASLSDVDWNELAIRVRATDSYGASYDQDLYLDVQPPLPDIYGLTALRTSRSDWELSDVQWGTYPGEPNTHLVVLPEYFAQNSWPVLEILPTFSTDVASAVITRKDAPDVPLYTYDPEQSYQWFVFHDLTVSDNMFVLTVQPADGGDPIAYNFVVAVGNVSQMVDHIRIETMDSSAPLAVFKEGNQFTALMEDADKDLKITVAPEGYPGEIQAILNDDEANPITLQDNQFELAAVRLVEGWNNLILRLYNNGQYSGTYHETRLQIFKPTANGGEVGPPGTNVVYALTLTKDENQTDLAMPYRFNASVHNDNLSLATDESSIYLDFTTDSDATVTVKLSGVMLTDEGAGAGQHHYRLLTAEGEQTLTVRVDAASGEDPSLYSYTLTRQPFPVSISDNASHVQSGILWQGKYYFLLDNNWSTSAIYMHLTNSRTDVLENYPFDSQVYKPIFSDVNGPGTSVSLNISKQPNDPAAAVSFDGGVNWTSEYRPRWDDYAGKLFEFSGYAPELFNLRIAEPVNTTVKLYTLDDVEIPGELQSDNRVWNNLPVYSEDIPVHTFKVVVSRSGGQYVYLLNVGPSSL